MSEKSLSYSSDSGSSTGPTPRQGARPRGRAGWIIAVTAISVSSIAGGVWYFGLRETGNTVNDLPSDVVRRGRLVVTVTDDGVISAANSKIISNDLKWPVVIKEVVLEGTRVNEGDLIIRFECKELEDAIRDWEQRLQSADLDAERTAANYEIKVQEMENLVRTCENKWVDLSNDRQKFEDHDRLQQIRDADIAIFLAESRLELAEQTRDFKVRMNEDPDLGKPYSQSDIDREELTVETLKHEHANAVSRLTQLKDYDHPKERRRIELAIHDAAFDFDKAEKQRITEVKIALNQMLARQKRLGDFREQLDELYNDQANLEVRSDRRGLIIYDTGGHRRGQEVTIAVGENINPRQQLMIIPDLATLQVQAKVYEGVVKDVQVGTPALIRLDSMPGQTLRGTVSQVSQVPAGQGFWAQESRKVYPIKVDFETIPDGLTPNMTARTELMLSEMDDVLMVPIAAIFTEQENTHVWRVRDGRAAKTPIRVGKMNESYVQVLEGLSEDDVVLLVPPAGVSQAVPERDEEQEPELPQPPEPEFEPDEPELDEPEPDEPQDSEPPAQQPESGRELVG